MLRTGQGEHWNTGWLLKYDFNKNNYGPIGVFLSWKKKLYADLKEIQKIEFVEY